ncbi:hypothetical protein FRC04_005491 [Tulasnella sp. 424]|nr:hypothetical protein FRC04_005491 [Tulasnella sp. 424]KAG8962296.1 hypothetical protein FRC05_005453 [Tulasnella sp. 425]
MHNATEGYIIGSRPNDQRHAVHYPSYPTNANSSTYSKSPSSAAAASTSPCCPAPLGLDNPFATGSDISAPSSPLSVDFDHPSCLSPPKSSNPFSHDSEISAPPSPASVDFDRSCYFGGLGLDNPFATGSDVSVPSSPFSVNSNIPEDAATDADTPTQQLNDIFSHGEDANHHPYLHQSGESDVVGTSSNNLRRRQRPMDHPPAPKDVLFDRSAIPATISPSHPLPQSLANPTALNHCVLALTEDGASPIRIQPGIFDSSGVSPTLGYPRQFSDVTVETFKRSSPPYHLAREIRPSLPFGRKPTGVQPLFPPRTVEVNTLTTATFERAANTVQVNSPGQIIQEDIRAGPGPHHKATLSFADDSLQPVQNNTQDSSPSSELFTRLWLETQQFPNMSIGEPRNSPYLPNFIPRTRGSYNLHCQLEEILPELLGELVRPSKPLLRGGYADVYKGTWTQPHGEKIDVAIKVLRAITPTSITLNQERLKQKILIIRQAALALAHLHNQTPPICHGDIKPENVLVNDFREAALSDFGVSRIVEDIAVRTGLTTTEQGPKGTYIYTAPEIFDPELLEPNDGEAKASCEGDVYAFGGLILTVSHAVDRL